MLRSAYGSHVQICFIHNKAAMTDDHRVSAHGSDGELTVLKWSQGGQDAELSRTDDGWVMKIGNAYYHLVRPLKQEKSIYSTTEGLQYEAQTVTAGACGYI